METVFPVNGVRLGIASAGIKKVGRKDLVIIELAPGTATAAVFTRNDFCAAPVVLARQHLSQAAPRYLMINTGNANAGTGESGLLAASATVRALAERVGCAEEEVLPFSTGVIGEPLPVDKLVAAQAPALADLHEDHWQTAAEGIMTTDTRPKVASVQIPFGDHYFSITGITKGAGMIRPNMATMLSFVATDLAIAPALLKVALSRAVEQSYHRITIDGDTSTNDACTLSATGASSLPPISSESDPLYLHFCDALESLLLSLAQAMVRDGEGATKFFEIQVHGGLTEQECLDVAFTIAESPLVKTAVFASDPNWGRLLAAIGRAGLVNLAIDQITLTLNDVLIAERGQRAASYTEADGVAAMAPVDIVLQVGLNRGTASTTVYTSDFSYDYVRINAEYRT
jgi:glutamate N-acetyltransferase / amino-acid N-acetyltransferase